MTIQLFSRFLLLTFCLFSIPLTAATINNLQAPQLIIENTSQALKEKLQNSDFAKNKAEIRNFVEQEIFPHIDTVRMSALVLGKYWRTASKEQKVQFIAAFKNLLINTYSATFSEQFQNWSIEYLPLTVAAEDKSVTVKTTVHQAGKPDAKIDYSMVQRNNEWLIYDLKIEGISLIISNRDTFSQMMKDNGSLDTVIAKLEEKNNL
ncbi:MAG: ABC transporter substrate-binding protein [Methyloprofundus sp.]|nr:ABC transporter substrate-binding protein [Methyloprofundus sp.]MDT8425368.1 ABC transporter substrate-binding protein [Methyloprofundus sp.]